MVCFLDMPARRQQKRIPTRFVRKQKQPLGVGIQATYGIDSLRKTKVRKRAVCTAISGKLREHAVGFVKSEEHAGGVGWTEAGLAYHAGQRSGSRVTKTPKTAASPGEGRAAAFRIPNEAA
jgi:hypothetical protein